jgi:flagellar basal body-associated protein FliL
MRSKKGAVSIPILILVIMTLILTLVTLYSLASRKENDAKIMQVPSIIDQVYLDEASVNYHLQEIFDKTTENFKPEDGEGKFLEDYSREMQIYKKMPISAHLETNITDFFLNEEKLVLTIEIELTKEKTNQEQEIFVKHTYEKTFEKVFK